MATRPWVEVRDLEILPGSTLGAPTFDVPAESLPSGPLRTDRSRKLDPSLDGLLKPDESAADARREEAMRRCLLVLWLPHSTTRGVRVLKPSSWLSYSWKLMRMVTWTLQKFPSWDGTLFSHLSPDQVAVVVSEFEDPNKRTTRQYGRVFRYLEQAGARGILADFPVSLDGAADRAREAERSWKGVKLPVPPTKGEQRRYQPFPDAFVSELLGRALWLQRNLADQVITCWARYLERVGRGEGSPAEAYEAVLGETTWRNADGEHVTGLPFDVVQDGIPSRAWPPRDPDGLQWWVEIIQGLNIHVVAFCTGARRCEIDSATDDSVRCGEDGKADYVALTYKLVPETGGELRDWPLHPAGVTAMGLQARLASIVRPSGSGHLWFRLQQGDHFGKPAANLTICAIRTVERLGLVEAAKSEEGKRLAQQAKRAGEPFRQENAHLHRWRATVARVVALTTVGAPQILLDLFGHRDINMTLGYMLSDRRLVDDARRLAAERTEAMATTAIQDVIDGTSSGRATDRLRSAIEIHERRQETGDDGTGKDVAVPEAMRHGRASYGQSNASAMARVFTLNGKHWRYVRPGVICTKLPGQFGPCTQGWGEPDAGSCQTSCAYRLETAAARAQCRITLDFLLAEHEAAKSRAQSMVVANLEEQIRENLRRWDDVRDDVVSGSPAAREIWLGATT